MFHIIFLLVLGLIWVIFANVQDFRKNEIYNWVSFSLIIFALGFRFFYALFSKETGFSFFYAGLLGLIAFFLLANLLYYGKMFAGGDAKLMMALGTIIPFSESFNKNLELSAIFIVLFLLGGALYGLLATIFLAIKNQKNFRKEFSKQFKKYNNLMIGSIFLALLFVILGFSYNSLIWLGIFVFLMPYLYLVANSVDQACMVKKVSPEKLTEGDWLYKDAKTKDKKIKADWHGLSKKDIKALKERGKKVWVRYGIPYSISFLIALIAFTYMYINGLGLEFFSSLS